MAEHRINGQRWPDGTTVAVYPAAAWTNKAASPSGAAVDSSVVSGGAVVFDGLEERTRFVAYALGIGVTFLVPRGEPGARADRQRIEDLEATIERLPLNLLVSLVPFADVTGDGTTDDTAAIQARLDAADGRGVFAPRPDVAYKIGSLTISEDDSGIVGEPGTVFASSATTQAIKLEADDVRLARFGIVGTYANTEQKGVLLNGATGVDVEELVIVDCGDSGVMSADATIAAKVRVHACRISHCGNFGIVANSLATPGQASDWTVTENHCSDFDSVLYPAHGIYMKGVHGATISDNTCRDLSGVNASGILASSGSRDITITGNRVENAHTGINADDVDGLTIEANPVRNIGAGGAVVLANDCVNATVRGNVVKTVAGGHGIYVWGDSKRVSITGNTVDGCTGAGRCIVVSDNAGARPSWVTVADNELADGAGGGVYVTNADHVRVRGNGVNLTGNTTAYCVDVNAATDVKVDGNDVTGGDRCIMVRGAACARIRIRGNTIGTAVTWGIRIDPAVTGAEVSITDNDAQVAPSGIAASAIDPGSPATTYCRGNILPAGYSLNLAAAATITLPAVVDTVNLFLGASPVGTIAASWRDRLVTLKFAGAITITDGSNLKLNGDFVGTADDCLTLRSDGTNWHEVARSAN